MLGSPVRVGPLDQDFVRCQLEMTVRQMHCEARQFLVTGQDAPDFLKAVQIAVVERRCLVQLRQVRPLHRSNREGHIMPPLAGERMTLRLRYLTWKLRALCWALRRL